MSDCVSLVLPRDRAELERREIEEALSACSTPKAWRPVEVGEEFLRGDVLPEVAGGE